MPRRRPIDFADRLRVAREAKGLSRKALADLLHVTRSTIGAWERREYPPELEKLKPLADAIAVDLSELSTLAALAAAA